MAWITEYITKKGRRYLVSERVNGVIKSRAAGPTKSVAIDIRNKWESDSARIHAGLMQESRTIEEAIAEYLNVCAKGNKKVSIIRNALRPLESAYGDLNVSEIMQKHIERIVTALLVEEGRKPAGINVTIRNVKTFLFFCKRQGYVEKNVVAGKDGVKELKAPSVARFLTRHELTVFLRGSSRKLRKALVILLYTGMRRGELLDLKPHDFDGDTVFIHKTKTGSARRIAVQEKVKRLLPSVIGEWKLHAFKSAFARTVKRWGLGRIRAHDFRHTFASAYLKSGGTLADLKEILGHKTMTALIIYAHFQPTYLDERMRKVRV